MNGGKSPTDRQVQAFRSVPVQWTGQGLAMKARTPGALPFRKPTPEPILSRKDQAKTPASSLTEIVSRVHQVQQDAPIKGPVAYAPADPVTPLPLPSRFQYKSQDMPYHRDDGGGSVYHPRWYAQDGQPSTKPAAADASLVSVDDLREMAEERKLHDWGLGGTGKHAPLHRQEVYAVLRLMTSTFAWNTILYELALR